MRAMIKTAALTAVASIAMASAAEARITRYTPYIRR